MAQQYESGFSTIIAVTLNPADTSITLAVAPEALSGRMYITDGSQREWISYTGVSGTTLTGVTRNLDLFDDPATGGTGLQFNAGTPIVLVAMHDQLPNKKVANTFVGDQTVDGALTVDGLLSFTGTDTPGVRLKSLTTAQRDALTPANGDKIYNSTTGTEQTYYGGQWNDAGTSTVANASTTVAGKVEQSTPAQTTNGDILGETGAPLFSTPADVAKVVQSGSWLYAGASATGNDTYVVSMTPDLTAYTLGMRISFKADVANTGACSLNVDGLGAIAIKTQAGADPSNGAIAINQIVSLIYDGTNFVIQNILMASDAEALAGTDEAKYINSKQLRLYAGVGPTAGTTFTLASLAGSTSTSSGTFTILRTLGAIVRAGSYQFNFDLSNGPGTTGEGRIYRNGVAFGTLRTNVGSGTQAYSENLTVAEGDVITFQARTSSGGGSTSMANVSVKYDILDWKINTLT